MSEPLRPNLDMPLVPVSWGELLDKISILEIKVARMNKLEMRQWAQQELTALMARLPEAVLDDSQVRTLCVALKQINELLWDVEDHLRAHEASQRFDADFIALARSVYRHNDRRAALKREINDLLGSNLREVKQHPTY